MQTRDTKWGCPVEMIAQASFILVPIIVGLLAATLLTRSLKNRRAEAQQTNTTTSVASPTNMVQKQEPGKPQPQPAGGAYVSPAAGDPSAHP